MQLSIEALTPALALAPALSSPSPHPHPTPTPTPTPTAIEELAATLAASTRVELDATRTRVRAAQDGAAAAADGADGADGAGGGGGGGGGGEASMQTPAAMLKRKKEQLLRSM